MTSRELVRRWYGQVKGRPDSVTNELRNLAAHTIIPSSGGFCFSEADFVPLTSCIDLLLTEESVRGYRASYSSDNNELHVCDESSCMFVKDLHQRPLRGSAGYIIDPDTESSLLQSALDMDAERECAMRFTRIRSYPNLAEAALSFSKDNAPRFTDTYGLRQKACEYLYSDNVQLRSMCVPHGYSGTIKHILRDTNCGLCVVELADHSAFTHREYELVFEFPIWSRLKVSQGQHVTSGTTIASMSMPELMDQLYTAHETIDSLWNAVVTNIGEADANLLLHKVWDSEVTTWAGMHMVPNYMLTFDNISTATAVWRDLRNSIGRVCHSHRSADQINRFSKREGKISVWENNQYSLAFTAATSLSNVA